MSTTETRPEPSEGNARQASGPVPPAPEASLVRHGDHAGRDRAGLLRRRAADDLLRHRGAAAPSATSSPSRPTRSARPGRRSAAAYGALIAGAIGGIGPITETTAQAAPLICAGLGVGLAFRAGLFNIGAQGQAIVGAMLAAYIGFSWHLPPVIHLVVAVLGGLIGGGLWGGIVGWLKARTGAHEVIVTIMMNYIAVGLLAYVLTDARRSSGRGGPTRSPRSWTGTPPSPGWRGASCISDFCLSLLAAGRRLVAAGPLDHRVRHPGGRGQPARRRHGGDERRPDHSDHHGGGRRARRARRGAGRAGPDRLRRTRTAVGRESSARSASMRSRSPCSAGPSRSVPCWPVCCSAGCTPGGWPCRASPRPR